MLVALLLPPLNSFADDGKTFEISGYYKNLFTHSKTTSTKEGFVSHLQRLRFQVKQELAKDLVATIAYDNDLLLNNFSQTPDFDIIRQQDQRYTSWIDLDEVLVDERHFFWKHGLYRAYVHYYSPTLQCTVGKQAIDWSRMRFYHPFDLFNPISPLDIEKDEKIGVDAINLELYRDPFLMLNVVYAPYRNRERQGLGARFSTKVHDYDLFFIAAVVKKDTTLGCAFDGYIKQAGFRGELTFTSKDNEDQFFRTSVGLDYSFTSKLYGIAEYFYNGGAKIMDSARFLGDYDFSRRALSITKHIIGAGVEYELSGVSKLNNYLFYDVEGTSFFYNPEFKWNIKPNFDLLFGFQYFHGDGETEFGDYHPLFYAEMKMYF